MPRTWCNPRGAAAERGVGFYATPRHTMSDKTPNPDASTDAAAAPSVGEARQPVGLAGRIGRRARPLGQPQPPTQPPRQPEPGAEAPLSLRSLLNLPDETPAPPAAPDAAPPLRLVGGEAGGHTRGAAEPTRSTVVRPHVEQALQPPISATSDPRWVVAVRCAELLQDGRLPPLRRDGVIRLAQSLGMSAFDANLVMAIIQEQARRGHAPAACPAAGERELRRVPLPPVRPWASGFRIALLTALGVLVLEAVAAAWWLGWLG